MRYEINISGASAQVASVIRDEGKRFRSQLRATLQAAANFEIERLLAQISYEVVENAPLVGGVVLSIVTPDDK